MKRKAIIALNFIREQNRKIFLKLGKTSMNELLIYRATSLNLEGFILNGKKPVSKITVYFHLYDFLERGKKTQDREQFRAARSYKRGRNFD